MRVSLQSFKLLAIIVFSIFLGQLLSPISILQGNGDDDDPSTDLPTLNSTPKDSSEWAYMKVEYFHDLLKPNHFFAVVDSTRNQIPLITGGYATTEVWLEVIVRGVDVPRSLQVQSNRNRPHDYLIRERERWNAMLHYVWNLIEPTHTFRAYNFEVVEYDENGKAKVVRADVEVFLGGGWNNLAMFMLGDEHARPTQADGSEWDFGSLNVGILNPNVPK